MRTQPFVYLEPKSLNEALALLDNHKEKLRVLSGGTETVVLLKLCLIKPQYIMSLKGLPNLKGVQKKGNNIIIGSATTLRDLIESPLISSSFRGIIESARSIAAPQIQNVGSVGGNILQDSRCLFYNQSQLVRGGLEPCFKMKGRLCRAVKGAKRCFSVYQGDLAPILIAHKAKAKLEKKGSSRTVFLSELFSGNGKQPINIANNELLTKIILPLPKNITFSSYQKLRLRGSIDYPLASAAASISTNETGDFVDLCVVIGAAGPSPKIVPKPLSWKGTQLTNEYIEAIAQAAYKISEGVNNQPLAGSYRRKIVKVLTKNAIMKCLKDIGGER